MFEVRLSYDMDESPDMSLDDVLYDIAGRSSDWSGCGLCEGKRDHGWEVGDFSEATAMRERLIGDERTPFNLAVNVQEKVTTQLIHESDGDELPGAIE